MPVVYSKCTQPIFLYLWWEKFLLMHYAYFLLKIVLFMIGTLRLEVISVVHIWFYSSTVWLSESGLCFRIARVENNHIFMSAVQHTVYLCLATMNMTNLLCLAFTWIGAFNSSTKVERCALFNWNVLITTSCSCGESSRSILFEFVHVLYVLRILPSPGFHVLFFLMYLLSKLKLTHGKKKCVMKEGFSSVLSID